MAEVQRVILKQQAVIDDLLAQAGDQTGPAESEDMAEAQRVILKQQAVIDDLLAQAGDQTGAAPGTVAYPEGAGI